MKHRIYIGGISGVGKTTLISKVTSEIKGVHGFSSSSFLTERLSSEFFNEFDRRSLAEREAIRLNGSLKIKNLMDASDSSFLVDGHFTAFNRHTKEPEVCFNNIDAESYTHLVLLDAEPDFVLYLRRLDKRRKAYSGRSYSEIEEQLNTERNIAEIIAERCKMKLSIVSETDILNRFEVLKSILEKPI